MRWEIWKMVDGKRKLYTTVYSKTDAERIIRNGRRSGIAYWAERKG